MSVVLVCGGRDFSDRQTMFKVLGHLSTKHRFTTLIHGAARGADVMAGDWATSFGLYVVDMPADWATYGKAAGPIRNAKMLEVGQPDLVVAFPEGRLEDSKGTRDMVTKAVAARVPVIVVREGLLTTHDGHLLGDV